jgi:hypothetical protein
MSCAHHYLPMAGNTRHKYVTPLDATERTARYRLAFLAATHTGLPPDLQESELHAACLHCATHHASRVCLGEKLTMHWVETAARLPPAWTSLQATASFVETA